MNILLCYDNCSEDQRIAKQVLALLNSTPGISACSYAMATRAGEEIAARKVAINRQADAVLVLMSADFGANDAQWNDVLSLMKQRPDLLASKRLFILLIRPVLWEDDNTINKGGAVHMLFGGKSPENERQRVTALKEMLRLLAEPRSLTALPEPGVVDAE